MNKYPIILVHGAYHGAWCWERMLPHLLGYSGTIFTPTLSGLGEKKSLLSSGIDLSTHIHDILQFIQSQDLKNVILVGHSYSGMIIAGVAEKLPERIHRLVYLDAMLPLNNQTAFDIMPGTRARITEVVLSGKLTKIINPPAPQVLGIIDPKEIEWVQTHLTPMPCGCYEEPIELKNPRCEDILKTYLLSAVQAPGESQKAHEDAYKRAVGKNWARQTIPGPHDGMITHPKELAEILISIAKT